MQLAKVSDYMFGYLSFEMTDELCRGGCNHAVIYMYQYNHGSLTILSEEHRLVNIASRECQIMCHYFKKILIPTSPRLF